MIKDNYFNATDMLLEYNLKSGSNKVLPEFFSNKSTKCLIANLCLSVDPVISKRGKYGYTLIHNKIKPYFYNWLHKLPNPFYIRDEEKFFDSLSMLFKDVVHIDRQKQFDCFFVDGYIEELGLCIEFDEKHHKNKKNSEYDKERMNFISEEFGVQFLRQSEGESLEECGNKILKLLLGYKRLEQIVSIKNRVLDEDFYYCYHLVLGHDFNSSDAIHNLNDVEISNLCSVLKANDKLIKEGLGVFDRKDKLREFYGLL